MSLKPAGGERVSKRQVVILAGGLGTRLRPITEKVPKPMVPVAGFPFLSWQIEDLKAQGYLSIVLLVAYLGEQVEAYFGSGEKFGVQLRYSYEPEPLGTGGALKHGLALLDEEFILLNGDSFLRAPLDQIVATFQASDCDALISCYDNHIPVPVIPNLRLGALEPANSPEDTELGARAIIDYQKDAGRERGFEHIDSGIYILRRKLIENQVGVKFMLADLWPPLLRAGRIKAFPVRERFYDIGTPERLKEFEEKVHDYFPNSISR